MICSGQTQLCSMQLACDSRPFPLRDNHVTRESISAACRICCRHGDGDRAMEQSPCIYIFVNFFWSGVSPSLFTPTAAILLLQAISYERSLLKQINLSPTPTLHSLMHAITYLPTDNTHRPRPPPPCAKHHLHAPQHAHYTSHANASPPATKGLLLRPLHARQQITHLGAKPHRHSSRTHCLNPLAGRLAAADRSLLGYDGA